MKGCKEGISTPFHLEHLSQKDCKTVLENEMIAEVNYGKQK